MSGGKRITNHWKTAAGFTCGAILLAGLAGGIQRHRSAKVAGASPLRATSASSARMALPSFTAAPALTLLSPANSQSTKLTPALKSAALALPSAMASSPGTLPVTTAQAMKVFAGLPMSFEANQGQTDPRVQFLSRGAGYTLFLTHDEAVLALPTKTHGRAPNSRTGKTHGRPDVLTMRLAGA